MPGRFVWHSPARRCRLVSRLTPEGSAGRLGAARRRPAMNIGFVGLGAMGAPMAARLVAACHDVAGFDMRREAVEAHEAKRGLVECAAASICSVASKWPAGPGVQGGKDEPYGVASRLFALVTFI
jgi:NAD binding domain of 6-phosphogluconate dehydrogenase